MIELPIPDPDDVLPTAYGVVLDAGRGTLPFALLQGEPLVACAAWSLGQTGVDLLDLGTPWQAIVESEEPLVLHDALCPLTPPEFLAACLVSAAEDDRVVLGVRPVTDTVKRIDADGVLGTTLDRDALVAVASPLVLPARVVAALADPGLDGPLELADLAARLGATEEIALALAPAAGRRVHDLDDVRLLEAGASA